MIDVQIDWNDEELQNQLADAQAEVLQSTAEHVLAKANELVPLDMGDLMANGHVEDIPFKKPGLMGKAVVYDLFYAVFLHEHPEWNFQHNRTAKWLENTIDAEAGTVLDAMDTKISGVIGE